MRASTKNFSFAQCDKVLRSTSLKLTTFFTKKKREESLKLTMVLLSEAFNPFFFLLHICQPSRLSRRFQKLSGKSEFQGMDATGLSGSTVWRVTVNLTFTES